MRLSREDGDKAESDSIANQRKMMCNFIHENDDLILKEEYIDDGFSGTNFERPNFKRMIDAIDTGQINCVIVKDLSRFGRNYIDVGNYLERYFVDNDIRFIAITDSIDSFEHDYDMIVPVKNVFNAQYARDISKKVQSSFKAKQKSGEFIGAFPSFGYRKSTVDRHQLEIDPYAANIVNKVFHLYIQGKGKMAIAHILNEEDVLCPSSYKKANGDNYSNANRLENTSYWTYSTINKILQNEMYIGNMVQGKTKRRMKGKSRPVDKADWIVVKNTHPPIIDIEVWEKVQNLLHRETKQLDLDQNVSIFAGFLKCGDCGRALAKKLPYLKKGECRQSNSTTGISYVCGSYTRYGKHMCTPHLISHDVLEQIVLYDLNTLIGSVDNLKKLIEDQNTASPIHDTILGLEKSKSETELRKVCNLKKEVYQDYKEGLLSKEDFLSYHNDYKIKEKLLNQKIGTLDEENNHAPCNNVFDRPWIKNLLKFKELNQLDRAIITDMIDTIFVYENNHVKIVYNFRDELNLLDHIREN